MISMLAPNWRQLPVDGHGHRLRVAAEDEGDEQVVPRPEELEDGEGGDGRQAERQDQPHEDADLRGAVDARRFEQVLGDPDEEVAQEEDREREAEGRVEEDQRPDRVVDVRPSRRGGTSG